MPEAAWSTWAKATLCKLLPWLLPVLGSMWHACHWRHTTHLLLVVPFPWALPCCSYFMAEPSIVQSKKQVWYIPLTSLTYVPQGIKYCSFISVGKYFLCDCFVWYCGSANETTHISRATHHSQLKLPRFFLRAGNDCLWWQCDPRKVSFIASKIYENRWLHFSSQNHRSLCSLLI